MKLQKEFKHAKIETFKEIIIFTATNEYIPAKQFKEIFEYIIKLLKTKSYKKLIFDKREITVFNRRSMEWYYLKWKPKAAELGLTKHRKILGVNATFNNSVELCRKMMDEDYPDAQYHIYDIIYVNTLEEAILK